MEIDIRKATIEDLEFLFNLRNEESVRKVSGNPNPIPMETHKKWFEKKLADPQSVIFIIESDGRPVAQTRYDVEGDSSEVSIAVVKDFRGRGVGTEILKKTAEKFWEMFPSVTVIHAFINLGNEASVRSFGKAGYHHKGQSSRLGFPQNEMILTR